MDPSGAGDLVTVDTGGPHIDGIVVEMLSDTKAIVAVMDRTRGPVLRTVHPSVLADRADAGPDDRALRLLVRRTPPAARGASRGGSGARRGRAGHTRTAAHRPTGR